MLKDEMKKYEAITCDDASGVSVERLGAFLDGYDAGYNQCELDWQKKLNEKEDKYHWHDLRKNPEDLPKEYHDVYVCVSNRSNKTYNRTWFEGRGWRHATSKKSMYYKKESIVAWREIEPFKEESDET